MNLDPDELLITLRPDPNAATPLDQNRPDDPEDSPYANLTKFVNVLEPLEGTAAQPVETLATVAELRTTLAEFHVDDAFMKLAQAGTPWMTFDRSRLAQADADTLLTFISATYEAQDLGIDPQAVHRTILDGSLLTTLHGLASVESTVSA
ncbi:hypothetical protein NQ038_07740 [Brevibacterium sp. 50QC2O2]|uniref:hypothetical protein n=1 Tax=Brevibacterium sp. 50QC2O2 TaxID=2968459 RepID=UPI00211C4038|nr:hypothetical protein [Brevibacterium sp. 50QC2O2]MCQ9388538.1 hypothetical protein [Brevibacterium sp. 50QC2O2]